MDSSVSLAVGLPVIEKPSSQHMNGNGHSSPTDDLDEEQTSHHHLVEKIRADRIDLEQKIQNLKNHIDTCSKVMKQLKKRPGNREKYENLTKTRASLVANAVHLQQLLKKLKQSESQAGQLADREQVLASESSSSQTQAASVPVSGANAAPGQQTNVSESTSENPEEETKEELMRRIKHSQTQLRIMESQQQKLRAIKEDIQKKLTLSKLREIELVPTTPAGNSASTTHSASVVSMSPSRGASASAEVLTGSSERTEGAQWSPPGAHSPHGNSETPDTTDLQSRLAALQQRRNQLDSMVQHLASLQQSADSPPCPPLPTVGAVDCDSAWEERNAHGTLSQHRSRLHQLERTLQILSSTLHSSARSSPDQQAGSPTPQTAGQDQEDSVRQQDETQAQELAENSGQQPECHHLSGKQQEMEHTRQQLRHAKQLMSAVELARASGQRLGTSVPRELTQLLSQPSASADHETSQHQNSQRQASEYVNLLKNMAESVDFLQEVNDRRNKAGEITQEPGKQLKLGQ